MIIFKKAADASAYLSALDGKTGFVPTMGALHKGHHSLLLEARKTASTVVCSIFINPTQFNSKEDLAKYPVTIEADITLLSDAGCDVLFLPDVVEIYPKGLGFNSDFDLGYLDSVLEGAYRPGHFKGVSQVMIRLLDIVKPQQLFLGQKDYQQCLVIQKIIEQSGNREMKTIICPTMREPDGLAMSSRNTRLTEPQRALAGIIYQCLVSIAAKEISENFPVVKKECTELMNRKGFETEYVELADAETLELLSNYDSSRKMVALIAAKIGGVRLIDNLVLES